MNTFDALYFVLYTYQIATFGSLLSVSFFFFLKHTIRKFGINVDERKLKQYDYMSNFNLWFPVLLQFVSFITAFFGVFQLMVFMRSLLVSLAAVEGVLGGCLRVLLGVSGAVVIFTFFASLLEVLVTAHL